MPNEIVISLSLIESYRVLKKEIAYVEHCNLVENFVKNISDYTTRLIFQCKYIEDEEEPTWLKVAFKINRHEESYPRKKALKYLKSKGIEKE